MLNFRDFSNFFKHDNLLKKDFQLGREVKPFIEKMSTVYRRLGRRVSKANREFIEVLESCNGLIKLEDFCQLNKKINYEILTEFIPLYRRFDISKYTLNQIYQGVCLDYSKNKINKKNIEVLYFLTIIDPLNKDYHFLFGRFLELMGDYALAIQAYSIQALLDISHPKPIYRIGSCYKEMGNLVEAKNYLLFAVEQCKDKEEYSLIKNCSQALLKSIKKNI